MSILRDRLKTSCPELWQALENSWRIAIRTWLPMVDIQSQVTSNLHQIENLFKKSQNKISKAGLEEELLKAIRTPNGSFNSLPHLLNLENRLDRIVLDLEKYYHGQKEQKRFELTPIEIYVLCSAIIFHDIGRIKTKIDPHSSPKKDNHGSKSKEILLEVWAELGVFSEELASIIGDICAFHTDENWGQLNTIIANQFGTIRVHELACLLVLIDEMDDDYTRVFPEYMQNLVIDGEMDFKVALRRPIQEVYFAPQKQTVFTVLSKTAKEQHNKINIDFKHFKILLEKKQKLLNIQQPLSHLGIYIQGWRLEYEEQLFDIKSVSYPEDGTQDRNIDIKDILKTIVPEKVVKITIRNSFEACFYLQYLTEMVDCMWDLSTQIFGSPTLTYESLASAMRETDIEKVQIAVNRLAIMSRRICRENDHLIGKGMDIQAGQKHWKWPMKPDKYAKNNLKCLYIKPAQLKKVLIWQQPI